jgi:hypothetical protein
LWCSQLLSGESIRAQDGKSILTTASTPDNGILTFGCQARIENIVSTETLEPPRDANGIPILPGYRKPFTSETGRAAALKSREALKPARALLASLKLKATPLQAMLATYRRAIRRHTQASIAETDARKALSHAKAAKLYHDMEQSLLGNGAKRGIKRATVLSPHDFPMPDAASIGMGEKPPTLTQDASLSGQCGVDTPNVLPASGQATHAPVDDTPF